MKTKLLIALFAFASVASAQLLPDMPRSQSEQDCGIVAAEAYARLKPVVPFVRIIRITMRINGEAACHAMVAYRFRMIGGHVFLYDTDGSYELDTTGTTEAELLASINRYCAKVIVPTMGKGATYYVTTLRFISD